MIREVPEETTACSDQQIQGFYRRHGKYLLDLTLVLLALPIVIPVIAILALLVMLDGGAPFFLQKRIGRGGRSFTMVKLRSMVPGAETELEAHFEKNPEARPEWELKQKLCKDPRVTWLGQLLRRTSLDELPQLWNVLRRDMSLVGPRPIMPEQQTLYPGTAYYRLLPGISGPWQVSDRNESSFADRAIHDTEYDSAISLRTDLWILLRTVRAVTRGTGY